MNFEITKSKTNYKKMICSLLVVILVALSCQPSFTTVAAYLDDVGSGFSVTGGNVTSGNVTCGNVTSGNVNGLYLKLSDDCASFYVADALDINIREVTIPSSYNGLPVTSIGSSAFYNCRYLKSVTIPDSVTSIGDGAFNSCDSLISITIPDSVTNIGRIAFYYCRNLVSITIPDSVTSIGASAFYNTNYYNNSANWDGKVLYIGNHLIKSKRNLTGDYRIKEGTKTIADEAFYNCDNLDSVTIPGSVTSIGDYAFYHCSYLDSITIADGVASIGEKAFCCCFYLDSIVIPDSVTSIGKCAFLDTDYYDDSDNWEDDVLYIGNHLIKANGNLTGDYQIKESTKTIADEAFDSCSSLTSITIPDSVTSIGDSAFYYCSALTSITIPDGVTSIGDYAFYYCSALDSITIPDGVKTIGKYAFYNCDNLTSVIVPDSVITIGSRCFEYCSNLTRIKLSENLKGIGKAAFYGCESLVSVTIPENVLVLGMRVFEECESLHTVTILGEVFCIDNSAFSGCNSLTNFTIPDSVIGIGKSAFNSCYSITSIELPDGINNIASGTFCNCYNLKAITIPDNVIAFGSDAFYSCSSLKSLYVPAKIANLDASVFMYCSSLASIDVSKENENYSSVDGVLFNKDKTKLIKYPEAKTNDTYEILSTVTSIDTDAFYSADFSTLILNRNISNIKAGTFNDLYSLRRVIVPLNVTSVSSGAFEYCNKINDVFYEGNLIQWNNVAVASNNGDLKDARVHYNVDISDYESHYGEPKVTVEPTCNWEGRQTYICSCGYEYIEYVPSLGHDYSTEWTIDSPATCTTNGYKTQHCTRCDSTTNRTEIASTGHNYIASETPGAHPHITQKCTYCGDKKFDYSTTSNCIECNFKVTMSSASEYKLISYIGKETNVIFPAIYEGHSVTAINNSCFKDNKNIVSVKIPNGVTSIGSIAFMNCPSLIKVTIPASVTTIGIQAFYGFNGTIYCKRDSVAHKYAVANNINYVLDDNLPITGSPLTVIDYDNFTIRTSVQGADDIIELLDVSDSAVAVATASYVCGDIEVYGTGTIITVFDNGKHIGDFTLIVDGDINDDSVCDTLDCFEVERTVNSKGNLDGVRAMAADNNSDGDVTLSDYQSIVNKALA